MTCVVGLALPSVFCVLVVLKVSSDACEGSCGVDVGAGATTIESVNGRVTVNGSTSTSVLVNTVVIVEVSVTVPSVI